MEAIRVAGVEGELKFGPLRADPVGEILIGRAAFHGLALEEDWVPRVLATLVPSGRWWLLVNGSSTSVRVRNGWVEAVFPADGVVALPAGLTELSWPSLVDPVRITLDVGGAVDERMQRLRPESDEVDALRAEFVGTAWAVGDRRGPDLLEPQQRRAMAHLFRHLLEGTPRPKNLMRPAAEALGISEEALKQQARRVRARVNAERFQKLATLDDLGEYLVERAAVVTSTDLNAPVGVRERIARLRRSRASDPSLGVRAETED